MQKIGLLVIISVFFITGVFAQQPYFVDGYHGGIYGHYPMWKTQFIVDKLAEHPEWRICLEIEPETWDTVKLKDPVAYNNFERIVADSRIEFTNPTYAQPYCYNISGESLIRQFEYGIKRIHEHFPNVEFTTYSAEEPCFTSSLPQLLKLFGFKYAVLKCPDTCWGGYTNAYGGELVNWVGPDGTAILTVPRYACEELEENSTWQTKAWNNSDDYLSACFDYGIQNPAGMCFQDAGWKNGPWIGHGSNIKNNSIYVTWKDYIEGVTPGKTDDNWHFSQEDMLVSLMWGSQVLQRIAQEVRTSENKIVVAEKLGAMAGIENSYQPSQENIDNAWRTLMMAQHHDSWIVPYNRLNKHRTWAEEITLWTNNTNTISERIVSEALDKMVSSTAAKENKLGHIRVYNTTGYNRSEPVRITVPDNRKYGVIGVVDSKNKQVPCFTEVVGDSMLVSFNADVPSFGYSSYKLKRYLKSAAEVSNVKFDVLGNCIIENDIYQIVLDQSKGGSIKSLVAKKAGNKEYVDSSNIYKLGELRGHFYEDGKFYSSGESPAKITILEDNQIATRVKVEGTIAAHPFTQILTIKSGQELIDFDLTIDWRNNVGIGEYKQDDNWRDNRRGFYDDRFKLNVLFPTNMSSSRIYKDAPFDVCESRLEDTHFNTWDSIKHNIILHWVDLAQKDDEYGLTLLSDHTTSYSHGEDFPLALTAQYSGKGLWGPDYKITQPLHMKYAIMPHKGRWDAAQIARTSNCWNEPLITSYHTKAKPESRSYMQVGDSGYEISAVKTEGNNIIVRLFNAEGNDRPQDVTFNFPVKDVEEVDLKGNTLELKKIKTLSGKNIMDVSIPRFGLKTFRIRR